MDKGQTQTARRLSSEQCYRGSSKEGSNQQNQPNQQKSAFTNQQLIPIYTEWSNRYLSKLNLPPIHDLTYELRDPKVLVQLIHAVTFGHPGTSPSSLFCSLNVEDNPVEQIDRCLQYLANLGVNVSSVRAKDLHTGHLGETLSLIFALSHYKQQQKSLNLVSNSTASPQHIPRLTQHDSPKISYAYISQLKPTQSGQKPSFIKMSTTASKLRRPLGSTSSLAETSTIHTKSNLPTTTSKLLAPSSTRRVSSSVSTDQEVTIPKGPQVRLPSAPPSTTNRLKPPASSKLQRLPSTQSQTTKIVPNVTSLASSTSSSASSSSASFSSVLATTSGHTLTKSQLKPPKSLRPPTSIQNKKEDLTVADINTVKTANTTKTVNTVNTVKTSKPEVPAQPVPSKMLKFFGKGRKSDENVEKIEVVKAPAGIRRSLKPPVLISNIEKCNEKMSTNNIQANNIQANSSTELRLSSMRLTVDDDKSKRTSKSSEEDSGFGGNSAALSLNSNNSSLSSGSIPNIRQQSLPPISHQETIIEAISENVAEDSGIASDATTIMTKNESRPLQSQPTSNSPQLNIRKPTLAVKAIPAPSTKRSSSGDKPSQSTPTVDVKIESNKDIPPRSTPVTIAQKEVPINLISLKKPTVPIRKTSRLQSTEADEIPDPMPQLKISAVDTKRSRTGHSSINHADPSPASTTAYVNIRKADESKTANTEEFVLDFGIKPEISKMPKIKQIGKPPSSKTMSSLNNMDSSREVEALRRTVRMNCRRREYFPADSCEDSSSISSGISENNFEDVSTDDLTGSSISDHQMTAGYGEYRKGNVMDLSRPRTSGSTSMLEPQRLNQRRLVEQQQNVVEELLQRSRTSQRSVAFSTANPQNVNQSGPDFERVYHTVHAPSSNRFGDQGQLLLSQDGETLNINRPSTARPSLRSLQQHSQHSNHPQQIYQNHHSSAVNGHQQQPQQSSSNYNTHSLDRHAHLKQFVNSTGELIYDSLSGPQVPYRYSVQHKPPSQSVYAASSDYQIGRNPSSLSQLQYPSYNDMIGQQQRRSNVTGRTTSQSRSASLSSANSSSLMSRSMILYESDSNLSSQASETNNNPLNTGKATPRQRLYAEMMAAIKARTPPRSRRPPLFSLANDNRSLSARLPNNNDYGMNLQLHKLSNELNCSPRAQPSPTMLRMNSALNGGSQLSLASSLGSTYSTSEDAYENMIRRLNDEMSSCRTKLKTVNKDELHNIIHMFDSKLEMLVKQVEKLQKKSAKPNDVENLMEQIEDLRQLSVNARLTVSGQHVDGRSHSVETPDMGRHPSMESVNSYASTKTGKDKNGFSRNGKKGWTSNTENTDSNKIRNSFSRAFYKSKDSKKSKNGSISECEQSPLHRSSNLKPIAGSTTTLDTSDEGLLCLKKQLQETEKQLHETEKQLGNFQLEALDKAREVDILQSTVNRLKNENKFLKHTTIMLERKAIRSESRTSSRQSLTCCHEEEGYYEQTSSLAERSCSSTSSSKRSSGGLNCRVVVNIDVSGTLIFNQNSQELNVGSIPLPSAQTTWPEIDQQLAGLLDEYMRSVDPEMKLSLSTSEPSIIGYQLSDGQLRDCLNGKAPIQLPSELITPTTILKVKLRGSAQDSMDSLCLESLFPREILQKLLNLLLDSRRLVINGSTGIGKSGLARYLGRYLAASRGMSSNQIKNIMFPNDENDQRFVQVQQELESMLKSNEECILLIDNIHRRRVELICEAFGAADEHHNSKTHGPFVIITLNRTSDLQLQQMQITYNVHAYSLYSQFEPVKGFLGRYLRRRIAQDEFTGQCRCGEQLQSVILFLSNTLQAVNDFIKDLNALDTIGPRIFLQCPLSMEGSRDWFITLWNTNIVPYMARIVRDSDSSLEWKDPTQLIAESWPWLDGIGGESVLHTVAFELDKPSSRNSSSTSSVGGIDAIYALDRIADRVYQSNKHTNQQQLQVRP